MSLRGFLSKARTALSSAIQQQQRVTLVIGNESADLDSVTSAICYAYLRSTAPAIKQPLLIPVLNIPAEDVKIRPELLALLPHAGLKPDDLITLDDLPFAADSSPRLNPSLTDLVLVDHNGVDGPMIDRFADRAVACIDHHVDECKVPPSASPRVITKSGSCMSLVIAHLKDGWDDLSRAAMSSGAARGQDDAILAGEDAAVRRAWDAQVAKLAIAPILIDTYNMTSEKKVENVDRRMVDYLESKIALAPPGKGAVFNRDAFFKLLNDAKSNCDGLTADEALRKDYKQWRVGSKEIGISTIVKRLAWLKSKTDADSTEFAAALKRFAESRKLDVFAITTANADGGSFRRELLVYPLKDASKDVLEKLEDTSAHDFDLQPHEPVADGPYKYWWQGNLNASRKQVGPKLREMMQAGSASDSRI